MIWLEKTLGFLETGGVVMIPLVLVSFWMWGLIAYKWSWLGRVRKMRLSAREAISYLQDDESPPARGEGPRFAALEYFAKHRCRKPEPDRLVWEAAIKVQMAGLTSHMKMIMVLAAVAPLLGLLGTVNGMVETFEVIGIFGTGNAQALASGIEEALITTQAGLMVSIPGVLTGQYLVRKVREIKLDLIVFHKTLDRWLEGENA